MTDRAPAVSVIIPTYQRRGPVQGAIDSVLTQHLRDFELIVVDDGSTDGTPEALARFGDRLTCLVQANRGPATARNAGLAHARGELVAFLDSDNRWRPEHLSLTVDALERHPRAVLAYALPTSAPKLGRWRPTVLTEPLPRMLVGNHVGSPSEVVVRRDALLEAGGFDTRLGFTEDTDLWLRLALTGRPFAFVQRPTVVRAASPDSLSSARRRGQYLDEIELGTSAALSRGGGDPQVLAWLQGRMHLIQSLRALEAGRREVVATHLAAALQLLPALQDAEIAMLVHLRYTLPADAGPVERVRALRTLVRAWPGPAPTEWTAALRTVALAVRRERIATAPEPARGLQHLMLRTERGPLRPLWGLAYESVARSTARYLTRGIPAVSAYLRGGLATGEPIYGLSDIDLTFVVGDTPPAREQREMIRRRWRRLDRRMPNAAGALLEPPQVYLEADLDRLAASSPFTMATRAKQLLPTAREQRDHTAGSERWRLYGVTGDWRRIAGPERRRSPVPTDPDVRRLSAWLELQFWWLHAFRACAEPTAPWVAHACVKLMTEPARVWLWLVHGERVRSRRALIERAKAELPDERDALTGALKLLDALERDPAPPLPDALASLARMTGLIAARLAADAESTGTTEVRLVGSEGPLCVPEASLAALRRAVPTAPVEVLPLADWRARVWSLVGDECFVPAPEVGSDVVVIGSAATAGNRGAYLGLEMAGLLVLPSLNRSRMRAVQCPPSDPVSFALLRGAATATFPNVPGWSVRDGARRAASEHLGWMGAARPGRNATEELGRLFSAARAAFLLESVETGDPELLLTVRAVAERLTDRSTAHRTAVDAAHEALCEAQSGGEDPEDRVVAPLRRILRSLPIYQK